MKLQTLNPFFRLAHDYLFIFCSPN